MINKTTGENIKYLREMAGLNQSNIADFLGVDQSLVSKIEKGERNISSDMLENLACLFGVTVYDIESGNINESKLTFAFRSSELTVKDMKDICAINRIALNTVYMEELLKEKKHD